MPLAEEDKGSSRSCVTATPSALPPGSEPPAALLDLAVLAGVIRVLAAEADDAATWLCGAEEGSDPWERGVDLRAVVVRSRKLLAEAERRHGLARQRAAIARAGEA